MPHSKPSTIFIGDTAQKQIPSNIRGEFVRMFGEDFYKIESYDAMEPFFMTIVSSSNHWLFIASTGGLSAGRINAEHAIFPYYTVDKLTENSDNTGHKAIFLVTRAGRKSLWEPFSARQNGVYAVERNMYKNIAGTTLLFEEINHSLRLVYSYAWRTSDLYGFVKTSWLRNEGEIDCQIELLDGLQNVLPANVSSQTQNVFGSLLDAYKRSELDQETGMAILALNSTLTDLAEPSESLLATTVFQLGLTAQNYLISSQQLDAFRMGLGITTETEVRGQRGAYFVHASVDLPPGAEQSWHLVAEADQDGPAIVRLTKAILADPNKLETDLIRDIEANTTLLEKIVAMADGIQATGSALLSTHHFANVMFNAMRGGIFEEQYWVDIQDFTDFVNTRRKAAAGVVPALFDKPSGKVLITDLLEQADASGSADMARLAYAYLPLSFSRRHGDPSRPWNRFSINIKNSDGSRQLNYEGNWRDIFQNWEALAYAYPEYIESMICTFLNATTADGYNPYRITREGIDWEAPEPGNPWANIGYWSDHQIIYLQKLLEISVQFHPGRLQDFLDRPFFSYANVPYRIKPYADLQNDPYNTIAFDWDLHNDIQNQVEQIGTDGKLLLDNDGQVMRASLTEKMLTLLLAKLVNFVPEGGIWMNTQRPEWNDANNALVGKGLSVVTLCYLRRAIVFYKGLLEQSGPGTVHIRAEIQQLFSQIVQILRQYEDALSGSFDDRLRRDVMDALGQAGSDYREQIYTQGLSQENAELPVDEITAFLDLALRYVDHSLRANRREDHLYHAYNTLSLENGSASVSHLYEMLEGQVAVLSSGLLSGEESVALLNSMRSGPLYRADQQTYILYPDRTLPGFLERNTLTPDQVAGLQLAAQLEQDQDPALLVRDIDGNYHFSGLIRNDKGVKSALAALQRQPKYAALVEAEGAKVLALFEQVFRHNQFTGRSGTFFAYEGLGSIYWHMVSKLLLAVLETILRTRDEGSTPALSEAYAGIRKGQCFNKAPDVYGAFPTDPYSHTPKGQGAKQPGMTGMVKEEILARLIELGVSVEDGRLAFDFLMFNRGELLEGSSTFAYWAVDGEQRQIDLPADTLAFTLCQVPIILQIADKACTTVHLTGGGTLEVQGHALDEGHSRHIFQRDGTIDRLVISLPGE